MNNENSSINNVVEKKNFGKRKIYFYLIIALVIIVGLYALGNWAINSGEFLYGEWDCGSNIRISLNKNKNFEMYDYSDKNNLDVNGKFTISNKEIDSQYLKYTITLKTNNRVVSGEKLTNDYTTQYEITMDGVNHKTFAMINTVNYHIYECEKID